MTKSSKAKTKKSASTKSKTKAEQIAGLLCRPDGASIAELMKATGWQAHSVRGFLSGHLKKQGRAVQSGQDQSGTRRYRLEAAVS
jgi:hypothetical protein